MGRPVRRDAPGHRDDQNDGRQWVFVSTHRSSSLSQTELWMATVEVEGNQVIVRPAASVCGRHRGTTDRLEIFRLREPRNRGQNPLASPDLRRIIRPKDSWREGHYTSSQDRTFG